MTAKRFKDTFEGIEDTLATNEEDKYISCDKDGFQDLCEMLNKLHKENQQLKERNEFLKKQFDRVCIDNERMGDKLKQIGRIL